MASLIFNKGLEAWARGAIDWDSDNFKCLLCTASYTPDKDAHDFRDDVTNEIAASGGYTAGGQIVSMSVSLDASNDRINITLGGFTISAPTTITARKAVYYKARGGASSADELIAVIDFGSDVISTGGAWSLTDSTIRLQN
jgi:hypothetical protein